MPGRLTQTPRGALAFVPHPLPPPIVWSDELVALLASARGALGALEAAAQALPVDSAIVSGTFSSFTTTEAQFSSRIEGIETSTIDLFLFNTIESPPAGSSTEEVANYVLALNQGLQQLAHPAGLPVSRRLIQELHSVLMQGRVRGYAEQPGEFRRSQNVIGRSGDTEETAVYVPPPVQDMQLALNDLEQYMQSESVLDPLIRIAAIHYQFEAIHPFLDGNGRVGRLLISLLLQQFGLLSRPLLYLSAYFSEYRREYYERLLGVSQRGEWQEWFAYFLSGVRLQADHGRRRLSALRDLQSAFHERVGGQRDGLPLRELIELLFRKPIISVKDVEAELSMSYTRANRSILKLVDCAVLTPYDQRRRNRLFVADEIIRLSQQDH